MEDIDLKGFLTNIKVFLFIFIVFGALFVIILFNHFGGKGISINKKIAKEKNLFVVVLEEKEKTSPKVVKILKEENVKYAVLYQQEERYFNDFLKKVSLTDEDLSSPTLIYIEDEKAKEVLVHATKEEKIKSFIEENKEEKEEG